LRSKITDADVTEFMSEFARYLVAAGVTSSRFARITRLAFFKAASESAKFTNSRMNRSALAAMTGLTRVQVREFAQTEIPSSKGRSDQVERVIRGWNSDAAFATPKGMPRPLTTVGKDSSFGLLVRKYGGDLPARSILREMVRNGLVTVKGKYVHLNRRDRQTKGQAHLQQLSLVLAQLLRKSASASGRTLSIRTIVRETSYTSPSPKGRALMQRKSMQGIQAFVHELQAAGTAASIETPRTKRQKSLTTRTRIMVLTEELDCKSIESNGQD
jgi:hypothetical protein